LRPRGVRASTCAPTEGLLVHFVGRWRCAGPHSVRRRLAQLHRTGGAALVAPVLSSESTRARAAACVLCVCRCVWAGGGAGRHPYAVAMVPGGVVVADGCRHRLQRVPLPDLSSASSPGPRPPATPTVVLGCEGAGPGQLLWPAAVAWVPEMELTFVREFVGARWQAWTAGPLAGKAAGR
jgi:hypothetical protein